jgi:hypothetical protein
MLFSSVVPSLSPVLKWLGETAFDLLHYNVLWIYVEHDSESITICHFFFNVSVKPAVIFFTGWANVDTHK